MFLSQVSNLTKMTIIKYIAQLDLFHEKYTGKNQAYFEGL